MKWPLSCISRNIYAVAPLAGAWIEIARESPYKAMIFVAPLAGAWIEMRTTNNDPYKTLVAPLAGAWIEMASLPSVIM